MRPFMRLTMPKKDHVGPVRAWTVLGAAAALALAGCGSTQPDYYTLSSVPGAAQGGGPLTLMVRTPGVAGYLDRDYIVRSAPGAKLKLSKDAAWGEPLADMIGQTLTLDLQQRLPGTNVFTQTGAISTQAQATVELDVSQFAQDADGHAEIIGALSVVRPDSGPAPSHLLHLVRSPESSTIGGMTTALSVLLGEVADRTAIEARALGPLPATPGAGAPVPLTTPVPVPAIAAPAS